jgi:hypothetical protein
LDITAVGVAVAYLLFVLAGATGALSVVVWLFQEDMPDTSRRTERETSGGLQSADHFGSRRTFSASAQSERLKEEAA